MILFTLHELKGQYPPRVLQPRNVQETQYVADKSQTQYLNTVNIS